MSISLLYMPVKFQIEIAKDDKQIDFSLREFFLPHPVELTDLKDQSPAHAR